MRKKFCVNSKYGFEIIRKNINIKKMVYFLFIDTIEQMLNPHSDEELANLVKSGDESALTVIMERYTGKLLRYGNRIIPKEHNVGDIVQDVFITVYKNIQDFDSTRRFSPWIYRIAHNAFVDVIRKKAHEPLYVFDFDRIIPHPFHQDSIVEEKENEEMRVLLKEGLENLSPAYKEIVDLYYYDNFNYQEIADILHIPIGTVGIRLSRARKELKKNFTKNE
jgi:RNA polymerase sigma-70 factor (ECF subfamily)